MSNILEEAQADSEYTTGLRRWFHEHPESSFREKNTAERIRKELDTDGISYQARDNITVAEISHGNGRTLALRADMDALEIREQNEVPYRSVNEGVMHACGHDAHMAALLETARLLQRHPDFIHGTVKLIFQPAEEVGKGAQTVVDSGFIDDVDAFFGIHVRALLPVGEIALSPGAVMGGANHLQIHLTGKSGHGGRPHQTIDAIAAGAEIVESLQYIVSREIPATSPAVISVCQFHAGTRDNIVAGEAHISGTIRVLDEDTRQQVEQAVHRVVNGVAAAHRVSASVDAGFSTPILVNSPALYQTAVKAASRIVDAGHVIPSQPELGTEDFSAYGSIAPTFFAFVGAGGEYPHHSDRFDIDEGAIPIASALHAAFVREYFQEN